MKKALVSILFLCFLAMMVMGCSSGETSSSKGEAQYPSKTINLMVPWAAGGDTDVIYRITNKYLEKELGATIVVTNTGGGGGAIGAQEVLHGANDGYTILAGHDSIGISNLMGNTDFSFFDFEPVAQLTTAYLVLTTHVDNPWNTLDDIIEHSKNNPASLTFGAALGSTSHLFPLTIADRAGIEFKIVNYEGAAQRAQALLGNHVDLGATTITGAREYLKANQLKMIAIGAPERNPALPDIPTFKELGYEIYTSTNRGYFLPKGTPQEIIELWNNAIEKVSQNPEFINEMDNLGINVNFLNTSDYIKYLESDVADMKRVLSGQGII